MELTSRGSDEDDNDQENVVQEDEELDPTAYENQETLQTIEYIKKTFKKRVCTSFVQKTSGLCQCGYERAKHIEDVDKNETTWSVEKSTKPVVTDAFGVVEFPAYGQKTSKYIRVDYKTDVNDLWTLMNEKWQMKKPHLLISVTGGAQSLSTETSLKTALKEVFRKGLVEAAQSTGAWIITGGTNTGVMKLVGDAIRTHTLKQGSRKQLVAIGIATWGCITNCEALIVEAEESNPSAVQKTLPMALYEAEDPKKGVKEAPLDPNHTHFILVDDGRRREYGAEIELRADLENKISSIEACGVKIPIVCIVIEGGKNTVKTVKQAIKANTPVIVIEGSGRAADVIAYAYNHFTEPSQEQSLEEVNQGLWKHLKPLILEFCKKEELEGVLSNIKDCLEHRNMITVFALEGKGSATSIDYAIIMTLLRVKEGETSTVDKMKLALAWDRIDVVKEHIYTDETQLTSDDLKDLAFTAIVNNRVEFVKFFLERRLRLSELLAKHKIKDFYQKAMKKNKHLTDIIKDVNALDKNLEMLDSVIHKLVDRLFDPAKSHAQPGLQRQMSRRTETVSKMMMIHLTPVDAATELFFWAILSRLQSMAIVFLYEAKETFALSLIGHLMLKNLLKKEKDSESAQELQRQVDFFEDLTAGLLTECYSSNQEMTIDLLVRPIQTFAKLTALEIAAQANNQSVLAHQACQNLLTVIWMGKISDDNPSYMKLLRIPPLFLLAPLVLKFREEMSAVQSETTQDGAVVKKVAESPTRKLSQDRKASTGESAAAVAKLDPQPKESQCCSYCKRLWYFLNAPCVKFTFNCVSYTVFLLLYSILLLTNFYPKISVAEIVLIVWVVTIVCEEIRQIVESREGGSRKFYNYLSNKWNWVDLLAVTTFVVGLVLRLVPLPWCDKCFFAARIVLAFSLMTFYFRILHMFSIFRQLGPKLVMIGKMMIDLCYFMTILMVFIIAYGITVNVILYPNQELKLALVQDVLSGAWWSVYGEFNIDEVSGDSCEASASLTSSAEDCASMDYDDFNRTLCPGKEEKCPAIDWFGPILLAIYALITNVMMINLLIAMFSNTFAKVEGIADVIWKIQRYHLVLDYESHPVLPPPFIVLEHAFRVIRGIIRKLQSVCPKRKRKNDAGSAEAAPGGDAAGAKQMEKAKQSKKSLNRTFRMGFGEYHERDLIAWLKANVEEHLLKKETEDAASDHLAKETNERIDQLYRKIEETEQTRNLDLDKRLKSLEEKMNDIITLFSARR